LRASEQAKGGNECIALKKRRDNTTRDTGRNTIWLIEKKFWLKIGHGQNQRREKNARESIIFGTNTIAME